MYLNQLSKSIIKFAPKMAKTNAERQKQFRGKKKSDTHFRDKEKARHRAYRKKGGVATKDARYKTRERVRKFRRHETGCLKAFPSIRSASRALGRTIKAVKNALPQSPRRRDYVTQKVAEALSFSPPDSSTNSGRPITNPELRQKVVTFYNSDDISRMMAGKRDYVIVRRPKESKQYLQKRYMYLTLDEAYATFRDLYPESLISRSKFCSLRPPNVLLQRETPNNVCVCYIHANFLSLVNELATVSDCPRYSHD